MDKTLRGNWATDRLMQQSGSWLPASRHSPAKREKSASGGGETMQKTVRDIEKLNNSCCCITLDASALKRAELPGLNDNIGPSAEAI